MGSGPLSCRRRAVAVSVGRRAHVRPRPRIAGRGARRGVIFLSVPNGPRITRALYLLVRSTGDPQTVSALLQSSIHDVDPGAALANIRPLADLVSASVGE